jgi:hypothetical protein
MRSSPALRRANFAQLSYPELVEEGRRMYRRLRQVWLAELTAPYDNRRILQALDSPMRLLEDAFAARGLQL